MKLDEIFMQLTYGELSQLKLGETEDGKVPREHLGPLLSHVNLGLNALHKRFPLKENNFYLNFKEGVFTYRLSSDFAENSEDSFESLDSRYIADSLEMPFSNDIHKIERVYTDDEYELGLNDESDRYACRTISYNVLWVPTDIVTKAHDVPDRLKTNGLRVFYRANHPIIKMENGRINPLEVEVDLPYSHLEALLNFVASRVNNPIGMANEFHAGNSYYAKYEAECARLEQLNLRVDQGSQNTRMERNGWV